mgnify:CR=1 FL=1
MNAANQVESSESITSNEAIAIVATLHEALSIDAATITSDRASLIVERTKVQTTTELLLLLARFHADVDDTAGSNLLAAFAVQFAAVESKVV